MNMRFGMAMGLAFCVLAGCETMPPEEGATEQEKSHATTSFLVCIRDATRKMDDGISGAYVIATAIVNGPCYQEAEYVAETYTRGENRRVKELFKSDFLQNSARETAVQVVLMERANRSS